MDGLTRAAVAGTARGIPPLETGLPTDELFEDAGASPEKELLLRAGARTVYKSAGLKARSLADPPVEPAPEETFPACSSGAADLVRSLLAARRNPVLPEALERLRLAGLRLPHGLLPAVLKEDLKELRPAVVPVLGERGRWLAAQNPAWGWAVPGEQTGDDETLWEEGALGERLGALGRVRREDPALGRAWVGEVWRSEKAEARAAMLEVLAEVPSSEDEPLLEKSLGDRSMKVRAAAADALARLPGSAHARRAANRADRVLASYDKGAGWLAVEPLVEEEGWERDPLLQGDWLLQQMGERARRIVSALAVVPPEHWEKRFGAPPVELAAVDLGEWEAVVLAGWCRAAARYENGSWALPLWERCIALPDAAEGKLVWEAALSLVDLLPGDGLAEGFARLLPADGEMPDRLAQTLIALPGPWGKALSFRYCEALRARALLVFSGRRTTTAHWPRTLAAAATRLSPASFSTKVSIPEPPAGEQEAYLKGYWRQELRKFEEVVNVRRRLVEEIPL